MKTALSFLFTLAALFTLALLASSRPRKNSGPALVSSNSRLPRNRPDFRDIWLEAAEGGSNPTKVAMTASSKFSPLPRRNR